VRNTQLDSSTPPRRPPARPETVASDTESVPFRYLPAILTTLAAALVLVLVFGLLAYTSLRLTIDSLTDTTGAFQGSLVSSGPCGLAALVLGAITLYFLNATRIAILDIGARPTTLDGAITQRHTGRGRSGGFWIVVGPPAAPGDLAAPDGAAQPAMTVATGAGPGTPAGRAPQTRGFVQGSGAAFGTQLPDVAAAAPRAAPPDTPLVVPRASRLAPGEVNLRIDKAIYQALAVGDPVQVVFSPHLQHVYYVRKHLAAGGSLILRNLALI